MAGDRNERPEPPLRRRRDPDEIAGGNPVRLAGRNCRRQSCPASRTKLPAAILSG
jgi:hypothetical protein